MIARWDALHRTRQVAACVLLITAFLLLFAGAGVYADGLATVSISPPALNIGVDQVATLNVQVDGVQDLYAAEFTLRFDAALIEVLNVEVGSLLAGGTPIVRVDNDGGTVMFATTLLNPAPPVSGSGPIAVVTIRGKANGGTVLSLESLLSNPSGVVLPARTRGGTVNVGNVQAPTSTARPTSTPRVTPTPRPTQPAQPTNTRPPTNTPPPTNTLRPGETPPPTATPAPPTFTPIPTNTTQPPTLAPMPTWTIGIPSPAPTGGMPIATAPMPTSPPLTPQTPPPDGTTSAPPATRQPAMTTGPTASQQTVQPAAGISPTPTSPESNEKKVGGLPKWLFITLSVIILALVGIIGIVVLGAIFSWYKRGGSR